MPNSVEINRIKEYYGKRKLLKKLYSDENSLLIIKNLERSVFNYLNKRGFNDFNNIKVLDVGCGNGNWLKMFLEHGALPQNLSGIDLIKERISNAGKINKKIRFICGNASKLPYKTGYFDIVTQFTMFTSILDFKVKKKIAGEMKRVLKKNGIIVWYDMKYTRPFDRNIKGISKKEIKNIFPGFKMSVSNVTLNPVIGRRLVKISRSFAGFLESIKILNSHLLVFLERSPSASLRTERRQK